MKLSLEELSELDRRHLWHPFTQMRDWCSQEPLIIVGGEGPYLIDSEGRRYLDGVSSLWVNLHGHRKREIDEAIIGQLKRIAHTTQLGLASPPAIELASRLAALSPPGLSRVFYSDDGSTAVEVALKMAFQFWAQQRPPRPEKRKFIAFDGAYHGDTLGAVSVGGISHFHECYRPLLFETLRAPSPYCYRCPWGEEPASCSAECLSELEGLAQDHGSEVAALIIEPLVQAAGGMIPQPPGFLKKVETICRRHEILLIADEVATGFGRTVLLFACQHEGVAPDLLSMAKGITGGYLPLAATLTTERVFEAFLGEPAEGRTFYHGHSYTGNPLACAAALANLEVFEKEKVLESLPAKAAFLWERLDKLSALPHVGDVRGRGLMAGVELVAEKASKRPYPPEARVGHRVIMATRKRGVILRPLGDVVVLMPPLCVKEEELELLVSVTAESIREVTESRGACP